MTEPSSFRPPWHDVGLGASCHGVEGGGSSREIQYGRPLFVGSYESHIVMYENTIPAVYVPVIDLFSEVSQATEQHQLPPNEASAQPCASRPALSAATLVLSCSDGLKG